MKTRVNWQDMTSCQWLGLAMEQEQLAKDCGPFDPAYEGLMNMMHYSLTCAIMAERAERRNTK